MSKDRSIRWSDFKFLWKKLEFRLVVACAVGVTIALAVVVLG